MQRSKKTQKLKLKKVTLILCRKKSPHCFSILVEIERNKNAQIKNVQIAEILY